jgi:hypothetical protein
MKSDNPLYEPVLKDMKVLFFALNNVWRPWMAGSGTGIYDQLPHKKNNGDDDDPDLEHVFALQTLDRLSGALGGEVLLPVSFSIISSYLDSTDWRLRYGALMSIAYLSEGSADLMETKIEEVMK